MIMAGRGRRLDIGSQNKNVGIPTTVDDGVDISTLIEKINQINMADLNSAALVNIGNLFNQLCSSEEAMKDLLSVLHDKALSEADFGEKLVVALEPILHLELNEVSVRAVLLNLIQNDFELRDTMCKSDPKKFVNAVSLLGCVYNKIKVCGAPIAVLGKALLDYFDLLVNGREEELKSLTKQILINGNKLLEVPGYDEFQVKLRDILINGSTNSLTKYWILLIIDIISNNLKPLGGKVNEFYISKLKDDYIKLESFMHIKSKELNCSIPKSSDKNYPRNLQFDSGFHNAGNIKKGLSKKFSDMTVKTGEATFQGKSDKGQISPGKYNKRDNWRQNSNRDGSISGHDDRFEKDENYYGVQMPRPPKSESKKLASDKGKKKEFIESKTSPSKTKDLHNTLKEEDSLN